MLNLSHKVLPDSLHASFGRVSSIYISLRPDYGSKGVAVVGVAIIEYREVLGEGLLRHRERRELLRPVEDRARGEV